MVAGAVTEGVAACEIGSQCMSVVVVRFSSSECLKLEKFSNHIEIMR